MMHICVASTVPICRLWLRGQVLCHEFMVETRHKKAYGLLVFGSNFQLSTIEPLKFSDSQKLLKNKRNKALEALHSALGYGRHNVSTRWSAFFPSAKGKVRHENPRSQWI